MGELAQMSLKPLIDLSGRAILITGASGGLGFACAALCAQLGASVTLSDLPGEKLEQAAAQLTKDGGRISLAGLDVTRTEAVEAVMTTAHEHWGKLDGLVHCAGILQTFPFLELEPQKWQRLIEINLNGAFYVTQAAGKIMKTQGYGSIVLVSSVTGRTGHPLTSDYAASKAGMLSLNISAAMSLAPEVRVNAVCPGVFMTPMWEQIMADHAKLHGERAGKEYYESVRSRSLMKRPGETIELARGVAFLLSDAASYMTGQAINIDGGMEMR